VPPYSPELNPNENVWQFLRLNPLANRVYETYDAILDACCKPGTPSSPNRSASTSIATRHWAQVNA